MISLPPEVNQRITTTGDLVPATYPGRKDRFMHLFRAGEYRQWLEKAGVEILAMSASGCLSIRWADLLKNYRQDEARWQELLRIELEASAESESLNLGTHLISVARKL